MFPYRNYRNMSERLGERETEVGTRARIYRANVSITRGKIISVRVN